MRLLFLLLVFAFVFVSAVRGDDDCSCWTPSAEEIVAVEATIAGRPLPFGSLDRYVRHYAGTTDNGRRFIQGKLVPIGGNDTPGIHVVESRMLMLQGEGCIMYSESGGSGLSIKCTRPGAWTPSDRQIAELEGLLQLPPDKYFLLQDYARYYAGVTESDRPIVIGRSLIPVYGAYWTAGIHIVSDIYFPPRVFDAGCAFVDVWYDPSTKEIGSRCGESFGGRKF
jgi:hypothetical protein